MSVSVSVDTSKLDKLIKQIPGNRDEVLRATAYHVLSNARKKTPVGKKPYGTGNLRANNDVKKWGESYNVEYYAEYAPYVEFGTWKMYARPFLRTSVETERRNFIERLKKDVIK